MPNRLFSVSNVLRAKRAAQLRIIVIPGHQGGLSLVRAGLGKVRAIGISVVLIVHVEFVWRVRVKETVT